jgi:hypothetical protein
VQLFMLFLTTGKNSIKKVTISSWLCRYFGILRSDREASPPFLTLCTPPTSTTDSQEAQLGLQLLVLLADGFQPLLGLLKLPTDLSSAILP